jgi:tRNA pseudouridine55 synthase
LGLGAGTRLLTFLVGADKTYTATIRLGASTVTDDAEGEIVQALGVGAIDPALRTEQIEAAVAALTGPIRQRPSAVSAIKVDGRRAYSRVRAGEEVELAARPVTVHRFDVVSRRDVDGTPDMLDLDVEVDVSSGTYVRALARDLGNALGVGGHLTALRRTRVGGFAIAAARTLEQLEVTFDYVPLAAAARASFPSRELDEAEVRALRYGQAIAATAITASARAGGWDDAHDAPLPVAAFGPAGDLVAMLADRGDEARSLFVVATSD